MSTPRLIIAIAATFIAPSIRAENCPAPLNGASRIVLVTTPSMNTPLAKMQLFTRSATDTPWIPVSGVEPAVVGKAGLGWGYPFLDVKRGNELEKVEGDKRTPAGFFRIGSSFGFAESNQPGHIVIRSGETVCVEDPTSPLYNMIRKRAEIDPAVKADDMHRTPLYRRGLFIDYPSDRATRRGSCIFIHIWRLPSEGTAGCVAVSEVQVKALQKFSQPGAVLVVLPETALDRFLNCLPKLAIMRRPK